jgi:hypothetical protein
MTLMKKFIGAIGPTTQKGHDENPFVPFFQRLEGDTNFPFLLAIKALEELEKTVESDQQLIEYLLEDIMFASIYATFYEHLFVCIQENQHLALELIDKFSEGGQEREQLIASQTHHHLQYIMNRGNCEGCEACDNHADVEELIEPWEQGDIQFFIKLYLGMQSIQFALEQLLYDILPHRSDIYDELTQENILEYRQFVVDYSDKKLEEA